MKQGLKRVNCHPLVSAIALASGMLSTLSATQVMADYGYALQNVDLSKVKTDKFECAECPEVIPTTGSVAVGIRYSDDDASARFNNTAEGEGARAELDADVRHKTETGVIKAQADQLGSDNAQAQLSYKSREVGLDASLEYAGSKLYSGEGGQTVFTDPNAQSLTLPGTWVDQGDTSAMNFDQLRNVATYRQRDSFKADAEQSIGNDFMKVFASYRQVNREGNDFTSGSLLGKVTALPSERDEQIKELTLGGAVPFALASGTGSVGLEFFQSLYENDRERLSWENPFSVGADEGRMATAPDNQFQQWHLSTDYQIGAHRLFLSGSQGEGEQDQDYLPYDTIGLAPTALPKANYDGQVDTTNIRAGWDYLISSQWNLSTNYRFDQRENNSDVATYEPVLTDSTLDEVIDNKLYSHEKSQLAVAVDWRWRPATKFSSEYEFEQFERIGDNAGEAKTHALTLGWKERWSSKVTSKLKLLTAERDGDEPDMAVVLGENPYFKEFTLADRHRNAASFNLAWSCIENTQMRVEAAYTDDDYKHTLIGVTEASDASISAGGDWQISEEISSSLTWQRGWLSWEMASSSAQSIPTWTSEQNDEYEALIWGISHSGLMEKKLQIGLDYIFTRARGETEVSTAGQYDDISSHSHTMMTYLDYQWSPKWQVRMEALYENFDESDWSITEVDTLASVIGSGLEDQNYGEWAFGLKVKYLID